MPKANSSGSSQTEGKANGRDGMERPSGSTCGTSCRARTRTARQRSARDAGLQHWLRTGSSPVVA
eukprot:373801-Rhodomonas_salina.1